MGEMNKLDGRQQLLVLMMEECGELIQECSKCLRKQEIFGMENLKKEIGDVYTLFELMHEWDIVSWTEIEKRRELKRKKRIAIDNTAPHAKIAMDLVPAEFVLPPGKRSPEGEVVARGTRPEGGRRGADVYPRPPT